MADVRQRKILFSDFCATKKKKHRVQFHQFFSQIWEFFGREMSTSGEKSYHRYHRVSEMGFLQPEINSKNGLNLS